MNEHMGNLSGYDSGTALADRDVVEIPLLLPSWQVEALASAAQDRGVTAGEMMRNLLTDFIDSLE
jgi:hypothetical protein